MTYEADAVRGTVTHYGPREVEQKRGGVFTSKGVIKEAAWVFDYDDLPSGEVNNLGLSIPAYAKILSARLEILVGFTSTSGLTDLTVGLEQADGTAIDADGFVTAVNATEAVIAARGNLATGTGALVGADIGSAAGELVVAPTVADLTAGRARVIVEYVLEGPGGA